jgi:phage tail sheath protein FI
MIARCEQLRDRFALLDPPFSAARDDAAGAGAIRAWRARFDSQFAAIYYPWMRVVDPLLLGGAGAAGLTRDIPPCGHVAGQMASTDQAQGVFKAPANAPLAEVQDVTVAVNDALHGVLNGEGINAIRALPGRGIRILGARTITSDTDWRFVNVRRLMMMIEKAILVATQWAVFEPNDVHTRSKLRLSLTSFLIELWRRGALRGDSPRSAFYVTCDATNNPPESIDRGWLLAEVGVAPSQPFEFVVVRVGRTDNQFQVTEVGRQ